MEKHKIQINTVKDHMNFVLHAGASGLLLGVTIASSNHPTDTNQTNHTGQTLFSGLPVILGITCVSIAAAKWLELRYKTKFALRQLNKPENTTPKPKELRFLQRSARKICNRLDIQKTPQIKITNDPWHESLGGAFVSPTDGVCFSESCIRTLTPAEQKVLLAHEIAHLKAAHIEKEMAISAVNNWATIGCFLATAMAGSESLITTWAMLVPAVLVTKIFVVGRFKRCTEYQADRISAHTTSPGMAINALTKMRKNKIEKYGEQALAWREARDWEYVSPALSKRIAAIRKIQPQNIPSI